MQRPKPIYVETKIDATLDEVWNATQNPDQHQEWDLRFSSIQYLPKAKDDDPQHFLYSTKMGFGMNISGTGESVKTMEKNGERSSSLRFWSEQPISLIKAGSGYWKYIQQEDGVQFLTSYDYQTRFGMIGRLFDKLLFRPLMGWATAWSFDCLRLWLEKHIHPRKSLQLALTHLLSVLILSFIWIYQGVFPKILFPHSGEIELLRGTGLFLGTEKTVLLFVGIAEIIFGLLLLLLAWKVWIFILNIVLLIFLTVGAALSNPVIFIDPFNPTTLNLSMIVLSIIAILSIHDLPRAGHCKRKPS